jgi:2-desacetyl-2-hydroxyethyl bacteriochlorophyllide A dehydrogenase
VNRVANLDQNVTVRHDARAFWVTAPGRGEIRDETLRPPGAVDVLVRALFSGISRGTEALVFHGHVPQSEWERMRAPFQDGNFPAPVKYGYINVGIVEHGPAALVGQTVFALYPHQTRYVVPASAVQVIPAAVPPERAVLAANMETAINGLWDARPHVGDRIAVIGGGTVGCLTAWLAARIAGCDVQLVDVNPARSSVARALGVDWAAPDDARPEADVVIHASGTADGLRLALALAGAESTVIELSWFGDRDIALPLGGAFHVRRLTIASSQVGTIPSAQRARWNYARRLQLALALLQHTSLDALISGESDFEALPEQMPGILAASDTLCHRIRYV